MIKFKNSIIYVAFALPVSQDGNWQEVSFNKIKSNSVQFGKSEITLDIQQSASPLVYRLPKKMKVQSFNLNLNLTDGQLKSQKDFGEDFYFRFGLIAEGENKLNGFKKLLAANWVKTLFSMVPESTGLDKIYFFNIGQAKDQLNQSRIHPKSDLMHEEVIGIFETSPSQQTFQKTLNKPLNIHGIWISSDGDDTKSNFKIQIKSANLDLAN